MRVPTTISPGPTSTELERLGLEIESHPIWTELRGPVSGHNADVCGFDLKQELLDLVHAYDNAAAAASKTHQLPVLNDIVIAHNSRVDRAGVTSNYITLAAGEVPAFAAGIAALLRPGAGAGGGYVDPLQAEQDAYDRDLRNGLLCTRGQSFTPDTPVVMADGTTKPLDQVKVGDKVKATDPLTGKTHARRVTKIWINHDTDLLNLTVQAGGKTSTIHTTQHHLFWDTTRTTWTEAEQLHAGDRMRTDDGTIATVASTVAVPGAADMWDLTVETDHDFYVATITANVLVHNNGPCAAETGEAATGEVVDVGHAGIHQFPGIQAGKSQFFDGENLGSLSNTDGVTGVLQKNGNTRFVMRGANDVGVDRTTGLPTDVYTVIRKPDGSVLTMFPGTSPMS